MTATDEWLAARRTGIGSSDVAAAYSGSYGGIYRVVADKLGLPTGDEIDPALADRGHRWEIPIADAVHALTGYYVHGEQMHLRHHANPHHLSTIDGLLDPRPQIASIDDAEAVLEIKTRGRWAKPNRAYWAAQSQWHLWVTGKQLLVLAVATIDDIDDQCLSVEIERIERDDFTIEALADLADRMWSMAERGELPTPDHTTSLGAVKAVNATAEPVRNSSGKIVNDPDVDLGPIETDLALFLRLKDEIGLLTQQREEVEARLRDHMGSAVLAENQQWRVRIGEPVMTFTKSSADAALARWPEYATTVLDKGRFKADHPDAYEALKFESTDRRITVKELAND